MCFYSDCYVDFQTHETPKARKQHRCDECNGTIQPGQKYHRFSGKFEGDFYSTVICEPCETVRKIVHDAELAEGCREHESWCPVGELRESIEQHRQGYGIVAVDDEYEPVKLLRTEAAHLFPELATTEAPNDR